MKEILEKLKQDYVKHYGIYERLERDTFDSSNTEQWEDTVNRIYEQGYSDALMSVIKLLEAPKCDDCDAIVTVTFEPYGSSSMATIDCPNCGLSYDTNLDPIESENK